jgi:hypothetical protein
MLRTARHLPVHATTTPIKQSRKNVHLFARGKLVADRWTERDRPNPYYAIGRVVYDVKSFTKVTDSNGAPAFNVTVTVRRNALQR